MQDTAADASEEDRALMRGGLHLGIVVDEHRVDFERGDFLVRNVLGGDPETGAIVVGDDIEVGQTVQFHVRDAAAADEDLREMLAGEDAAGRAPLHVQRSRHPLLRRARPRRRGRRPAPRAAPDRGRVLRR